MADLGPTPFQESCRLLPLLLTARGVGKAAAGGGGTRLAGRPSGSEVMIGNDGAGDTWDNDGVANSPDD